jgi:MoaA/NifB/PqqE/SkfB family radical SAM enzyme
MIDQTLYHTYKRYKTLATDKISALPIVILMPHSGCNCRCVMCDIWKDNKNLKQLNEEDVSTLLIAFEELGTKQVVMSGGEALLNPKFFALCEILKQRNIHITLLSTGISLKKHAPEIIEWVDDVIISLDGDAELHDKIRNIPGAFEKLKAGVQYLKLLQPTFKVSARTVIHRLNFKHWLHIIDAAKEIGVDQISFLPADVSSTAFNRETPWDLNRQSEVALELQELPQLKAVLDELKIKNAVDFQTYFIAESFEKLKNIYTHYSALHGLNDYAIKKCNAPWVSAVIESNGDVKPCFFHESVGNIRQDNFKTIVNNAAALTFRKQLDMDTNPTCKKCVCYLNLSPRTNPAAS